MGQELGTVKSSLIPALALLAVAYQPSAGNWCRIGENVIIPDGREGPVVLVEGDTCGVLAYGEKYVYRWVYYLIEPAHPKYGR